MQELEIEELRMNHCGLLIFDAARIYYEEPPINNQPPEMVSLITHLDCHMMRQPTVWEHYFLFRTNRNLIMASKTDFIKEAMSPIRQLSNKSFVYSDTYKNTLKFIHDHKDQVKVTLKEIVYYLTLVEGLAQKAKNILVFIFTKYKIDQDLVKQTLFLERRYNEAYLDSKIQTVQKPRVKSYEAKEDQLGKVIVMAASYLPLHDIFNLFVLNKKMREALKEPCFRQLLARDELTPHERVAVYRLIIPRRYKAEDYITDRTKVPINPSCARTIKLDLDRTCRMRPEVYQETETLLYNYLHRNDSKMGYFQGLNFIGTHIVDLFEDPVDRLNCIEHVITNTFGVFVNSKLFKDGLGMFIMFYILDRIFEMKARRVYPHMQREGIGVQLFAANPVITVFTWNSDMQIIRSHLMDIVWDSVILVVSPHLASQRLQSIPDCPSND
jgi:hypothetical protein